MKKVHPPDKILSMPYGYSCKFREDTEPPEALPKFVLDFQYLAPLRNQSASKLFGGKSRVKFRRPTFGPCKINTRLVTHQ